MISGVTPPTGPSWFSSPPSVATRGRFHHSSNAGSRVPLRRGMDGEDSGAPQGRLPQVVEDGPAFEERPHGVDGDGGGLILGEWLQPAGHGGHRDQRGAGEEENEHGQDGGHLGRLRVLHSQPDRGVDPAEGNDQGDSGQAGPGAVVEPEADEEPKADDERQRQYAAAYVRESPAGQERGPGHRQAPEPVDDAGLEVLGQGERRGHAAELADLLPCGYRKLRHAVRLCHLPLRLLSREPSADGPDVSGEEMAAIMDRRRREAGLG